ncbi:Nuclear valosin-containing protein-like [Pseudolycoriella hygida]|uniref:Nuclear valosin-containing protein-like n=1 Tax=Pseudolycoriella hygida TaxID=35572 RepID=A0A9Q0MPT9_9DIPT|nr:Nuclear valosin-containing protein-like [Pseudolycoriella hygida]
MSDQMDNQSKFLKSKPVLHDPNIIPRVKQYLEENVHKTYVDVSDMARVLQERYRADYGRRKMAPFRQLVEQAYKTVLHSYGLDSNPSSDDNEESDLEFMEDRGGNHVVSNMLTDMYIKAAPKKPVSNEVAINISSDESDNDANMAQKTSERSEKATHPTTTNMNQVTITKLANLPPSTVKPVAITPITQHLSKKRKILSGSNSPVQNLDNATNEKQKRQPAAAAPATLSGAKSAKKYKREFAMQQSKLTFENIGGMKKILQEICELLMHIKHPEVYRHIGLPPPRGFLLHGPPGSGKTLLAQSIAGQLRIGIIQVAATELVAGVSGESEERIRDLFEQATAVAPCVLFIDEIDAVSSNRLNAQKDMERRIVAQLLSCLDGLSQHEHGDRVLIIGATNRPDALDPALRRVGRFDQEICLGIPDRDDRASILQVICKPLTIEAPFDFDKLGALTPGYVGADLLALASRAASIAVKRSFAAKQRNVVHETDEASVNELLMEIDKLPKEVVENAVQENGVADNEKIGTVPSTNGTEPVDIIDDKVDEPKEKDQIDVEPVEVTDSETDVAPAPPKDVQAVQKESSELNEKENTMQETIVATTTIIDESTPMQVDEPVEQTDNDKVTDIAEDDDIIEVVDESSDAIKCDKPIHSQISFEVMKSWLSDDKPIMTADDLDDLCVTMADFTDALKVVQPSAKREGFITVPDVTWDNIGSLRDIREELQLAVLAPVKFPKKLLALGLNSPSGVLLCGPPGCGKTLLAKAVANEAGINFISVKGPELLNMYVGESERAVRQCFQRARNSAPCVIFFDEFDSLCPKRSDSGESNGSSRLVNQLLTEMDGIEERKGVFLMAATNRPDIVDPAVMRPGRLDKILYVGLPELDDRVEILKALTMDKPTLSDDVDIHELAALTNDYTGADLAGLVRQASLYALKESISSSTASSQISVSKTNFADALKNTKSSISEQDKRHYEKLRKLYTVTKE